MRFINLLFFAAIFLLFLCTSLFPQVRWEKISDRPAGVTDFKIFTFDENGQEVLFCNSLNGAGLFKSTDGGVTWVNVGLSGLELTDMIFNYSPLAQGYVVSAENGIYKSSDNGLTWTHHTAGIEGIYITRISRGEIGELFCGTSLNGVYKSDDGGSTWIPLNTGMENETVLDLSYDSVTGRLCATTIGGGFWKYNFTQNTWEQKNQGNNNLINNAIASDSEGNVYMDSGPDILSTSESQNFEWQFETQFQVCEDIKVTADNQVLAASLGFGVKLKGLTGFWIDYSAGLPADNQGYIDVKNLAINFNGFGYAAVTPLNPTVVGGIYKTVEPLTDVEQISTEIPNEFILEQNYPNPFNPSTTISFSIPGASFVSLKVFNSLGEEIETLVSKDLNTGNYNYDWNAESLTSGIYFYKLQTENFVETKKMILLK